MQELPDEEMLTLDCLIEKYGLICDLPWDQAFSIGDKLKAYLQKLLQTTKAKQE